MMSENEERNSISMVLSDAAEAVWNSIARNYKTKTVEKLLQIWDEADRPNLLKLAS
jgi:hypothetical protein